MSRNKRLLLILGMVVILLLIPFTAMQFSEAVNWSAMDFVIMGVMLFAMGLLISMVGRKIKKRSSRILLIIAVVVLFLLVWAELAVGVFGTPFAGD